MTHKLLTAVCALALVLGFAFSASAAVQNVKVGGDIEVKGIYQNSYDIYGEVSGFPAGTALTPLGFQTTGAAGTYDNDPVAHDYLMSTVRLYVDASLTDNVSAYVRLLSQRDWDTAFNFLGVSFGDGSGIVEVDLAYLTLNEMYGYPCSLTIGRQELLYGEGFLVGDGVRDRADTYQYGPQKGFDAIKAVWDYEPHQLDLFIAKITEGSNTDPVTGGIPRDTDNDLYGVNWNYDGGMYGLWDLGLFYNRSNIVLSADETQTWALSLRGEGSLPQIEVGTLALKGEIVREWGTVEPAMQPITATTGDNELLDAWAGYIEGEYTFDNVYAPYVGLGYIYMSGDDDETDAIEQFNPLFEDEKYGEIAEVVYGLYYLSGDTTMTNANIWKLSAGFNPTENTGIDFTYYSLRASTPSMSFTADLEDQDLYIGAEYDLNFTYNYSEDVSFGLMYGLFVPGDFFQSGADEVAGLDVELDNAQQLMGSVKVTF